MEFPNSHLFWQGGDSNSRKSWSELECGCWNILGWEGSSKSNSFSLHGTPQKSHLETFISKHILLEADFPWISSRENAAIHEEQPQGHHLSAVRSKGCKNSLENASKRDRGKSGDSQELKPLSGHRGGEGKAQKSCKTLGLGLEFVEKLNLGST